MADISLGSKLTFKEVNLFVDDISALVKSGEKEININMQSCRYLNSVMLSGLIRAQKITEDNHCRLVLRKVSAPAMTLFETTNVHSLFNMEGKEAVKITQETPEFSFKDLPGNNGLFELKGSLSTPEHCSPFREFYEKHIMNCVNGILDCSNLEHIGSSGVTEMFRLRGIFEEKSGKLIIVSQTDAVDSVWRMMHLESLIPKSGSVDEALTLLAE
jgi:anti-anti-sigma regulatory factor